MNNKKHKTPCLCDTCLKARDEELNGLREKFKKVVKEAVEGLTAISDILKEIEKL